MHISDVKLHDKPDLIESFNLISGTFDHSLTFRIATRIQP